VPKIGTVFLCRILNIFIHLNFSGQYLFMRLTILSILLFFSFCMHVIAQRQVDIGATKIYTPTLGTVIHSGQKVYLQFSVTNYGPDSFKVSDSLILYVASREGLTLFVPSSTNRVTALTYPHTVYRNQTVGFADSVSTTWSGYASDTAGYMCILVLPKAMAGDTLQDPIMANNSICQDMLLLDVSSIDRATTTFTVYPNPAQSQVNFDIHLTQRAETSITICDIRGRSLLQKNEGRLPAGQHIINLNTTGLSAGMYFYKLAVDGDVRAGKLFITNP